MEKKKKREKKNPRQVVILIVTAVVMIPILVVIIQNLRHSISIASKIRELGVESQQYQKSIEEDSLLLESIKYDEGLERYAREKFFMQRKGERVFILTE